MSRDWISDTFKGFSWAAGAIVKPEIRSDSDSASLTMTRTSCHHDGHGRTVRAVTRKRGAGSSAAARTRRHQVSEWRPGGGLCVRRGHWHWP